MLTVQGGLTIFDFDGGGPYSVAAFVGVFERSDRVNFLARPYDA